MSFDAEINRNERRDKKLDKKRNGMRVDGGAKKLAAILQSKLQKGEKV